jgi:hypothetical protein
MGVIVPVALVVFFAVVHNWLGVGIFLGGGTVLGIYIFYLHRKATANAKMNIYESPAWPAGSVRFSTGTPQSPSSLIFGSQLRVPC